MAFLDAIHAGRGVAPLELETQRTGAAADIEDSGGVERNAIEQVGVG